MTSVPTATRPLPPCVQWLQRAEELQERIWDADDGCLGARLRLIEIDRALETYQRHHCRGANCEWRGPEWIFEDAAGAKRAA